MFTNLNRTFRKVLVGTIMAGVTIFSAPTAGCDPAGIKDVSSSAAQLVSQLSYREGHDEGGGLAPPLLQGVAVGNPGTIK